MGSVPASAGLLDNLIGINLSSMVARCGLLHRLCKMKIILSVVMHLKVANRETAHAKKWVKENLLRQFLALNNLFLVNVNYRILWREKISKL